MFETTNQIVISLYIQRDERNDVPETAISPHNGYSLPQWYLKWGLWQGTVAPKIRSYNWPFRADIIHQLYQI